MYKTVHCISDCEVKQERVCFLCPVCRLEICPKFQNITAEEWAKSLPNNYQLQSIADSLAKQNIAKTVFCESCRDNQKESIATFRCKQCQHNLCETCCKDIHHQRVKGYTLHTIIDLKKSDFQNDLIGGRGLCSDHPDKEIAVYCSNHDKMCCTFCLTAKHSKCTNLLSLDELNEEDVELNAKILHGETQEISKISKNAVCEIQKNITDLNSKKEDILLNVAEKICSIKQKLDATYDQLTHSLNNTHGETISKLTLTMEKLELFDKNLIQLSNISSAVMQEGNRKQIFVVFTKIQKEIIEHLKYLSAQGKEASLVQLKWNGADDIENLANFTKLGDFECLFEPAEWVKEINRHLEIVANDADPKLLGSMSSANKTKKCFAQFDKKINI